MERRVPRADRTVARPPVGAGRAHVHAAEQAPDPQDGPRWSPGVAGLVERGRALLAWWQHTRPARANARFGEAGGGLLTGGIAYATLFSVFAALTIGYTVFMAVLGRDAELRQGVLTTVSEQLPGLLDTGDGTGLISPDDLELSTGLSVAGIVAVVVLLVSALSAVSALRGAVRRMFDVHGQDNALLAKARDLGGFVLIALAVLVTTVLGLAVTSVARSVLRALGWTGASSVVLQGLGVLVAALVDAAVFVMIVRLLAGQHPPRRDLLSGAAIAAVGTGVVRALGTSLVAGSVDRNPLLASFAAVVVLLLWINLIARIVLLAAAWTANPPVPAQAAEVTADG